MKRTAIALLCCIGFCTARAQTPTRTAPAQEPPALYILTINGKQYDIAEGQSLQIGEMPGTPTVSVEQKAYRTFATEAVSFNYPRHFAFSHEQDFTGDTWHLDGGSFSIGYMELSGMEADLGLLAGQTEHRYGKPYCKTTKTQRMLGGKKLNGKLVEVALPKQRLSVEFLELGQRDGKTLVLSFTDVKNDDGSNTAGGAKAMELIDGSILYR